MISDKLLAIQLRRRIKALNLDLRGRTVLTEAATGAYVVTPLIAAMAGAKVFAYSRNSPYGSVEEVFANTRSLQDRICGAGADITFVEKLTEDVLGQVDMITNSGHLRPLDQDKLRYAKEGLVIPLMYEAWEWRDSDMDIDYIRRRGFKVGATNERHTEVDVFNYLGDMAVKQIHDARLSLYENKFVLLCNNDFGPYIAKVLVRMCKRLGVIDRSESRARYEGLDIEWLSDFPEVSAGKHFEDAAAIIFTAYPFDREWIGDDHPIPASSISRQFVDPLIIRYAGDLNIQSLHIHGLRYFPLHVKSGHMGVLPSDIGYDPVIRLQAGGLKVGQLMLENEEYFNGQRLVEPI